MEKKKSINMGKVPRKVSGYTQWKQIILTLCVKKFTKRMIWWSIEFQCRKRPLESSAGFLKDAHILNHVTQLMSILYYITKLSWHIQLKLWSLKWGGWLGLFYCTQSKDTSFQTITFLSESWEDDVDGEVKGTEPWDLVFLVLEARTLEP